MAANKFAIYSRTPDVQWIAAVLATANTAKDGTGTVATVFTADATEGGWVEEIVIRAAGTNVATVLRVFLNNGSTNATPANNSLFTEITIAATSLSEVAALADNRIPMKLALSAGYKLNLTVGTTIAAGVYCSAYGGKY